MTNPDIVLKRIHSLSNRLAYMLFALFQTVSVKAYITLFLASETFEITHEVVLTVSPAFYRDASY